MSERSSRISSYKHAAVGATELRRKRQELSVALRKQARDEQILKRRAMSPDGSGDEENKAPENMPSVQEIIKGLKSGDLTLMTSCARAARRMLSREQSPPIAALVQAGVIRPLVEALDRDDCPDLQFESAWAITNIASGTHDQTMAVVDGNALPKLIRLVGAGGSVGEQCAWAVGNVAGDGAETRDLVLSLGALPALLPGLRASAPRSQLRTAVWTCSNLCRNKNPLVQFPLVAPMLPHLADLLEVEDTDVLADACWALSYLTDGPNERIEAVQTTPLLLARVVRLLDHPAAAVTTPALRALGNMVTGSDEQTDRCLDAGCLAALARLLRSGRAALVKEAAWAVSNVLAGTQAQIQRAIEEGILEPLIQVVAGTDARCQKEAAWAVTNLCLGGAPAQLDRLLAAGALEPYAALLAAADHKTIMVVLDGLSSLLQAAEKFGQVEALCMKLEEIGALDRIESLQSHENEAIYKKTLNIMDTYFPEQEEVNAPEKKGEEYEFACNQQPANLQF